MQKIDIIFNATLICPWDCEICCVDAVQVKKNIKNVEIRYEGLSKKMILKMESPEGNPYNDAYEHRKKMGLELSLEQKIVLLNNLYGYDAKLDVSGGDPLTIKDNYEFLKIASKKLGKHNITLTATGQGLVKYKPIEIEPLISEFNFTYDANQIDDIKARPIGYAQSNLIYAKKMSSLNCKTRAEFPLNKNNITSEHITRLYEELHYSKIDTLLLMRLFPVGRGRFNVNDIPNKDEYNFAINLFFELEKKYKFPRIKLQCALKHLTNTKIINATSENPCDLVRKSFGLMADGTLLASPWAINEYGKPLSDNWVLGNLYKASLARILSSTKAAIYKERLNDNFGHCKIFSYLNSNDNNDLNKIFDKSDSLYI
jgi:MoaA/NifB/PqqE/SkfB family radical SAM enzyme